MRCALLLASVALTSSTAAFGQRTPTTNITSSTGPLTTLFLGVDASTQIRHVHDARFQIYPPSVSPGDYGTFLAIGDDLFTPDFRAHGGSATGFTGNTIFRPWGQTGVTGTGSLLDPFRVTTAYAAGSTGIEIFETTSYVEGQEWFLTELVVTNSGTVARDLVLYRAADCYLYGSDSGYGSYDPSTGSIACTQVIQGERGRMEQWLPITRGSQYFQGQYGEVWRAIDTRRPFPNTCRCTDYIDNGAGLSWVVTLPVGAAETRSHITTISPTGALPVTTMKIPDTATVTPGAFTGYSIHFDNPNAFDVEIVNIFDDLPPGFTYRSGTTTGLPISNSRSSEPQIAGAKLVWTSSVTVPGLSSTSFHFEVQVAREEGTYFNNAGALAADGVIVTPTGETAPILVRIPNDRDGGTPDGQGGIDGGSQGPGDGGGVADGGTDLDATSQDGGGGNGGGDAGGGGSDTGMNVDASPSDGGSGTEDGASDAAGGGDTGSPSDSGGDLYADGGIPDGQEVGDGSGAENRDGAATDSSSPSEEDDSDSGCSCRVPEGPMSGGFEASILLALLVALRRARGAGRLSRDRSRTEGPDRDASVRERSTSDDRAA